MSNFHFGRRNRLWKPEVTSRKHPEKGRAASDVIIYYPDGHQEIFTRDQIIKQHRNIEVKENIDILAPEPRWNEKYIEWRNAVIRRDKKTCVLCNSTEWINVHHIIRWIDDPNKRYSIDNGVCLCIPCHLKWHGPHLKPFPYHINQKLYEYINSIKERLAYAS